MKAMKLFAPAVLALALAACASGGHDHHGHDHHGHDHHHNHGHDHSHDHGEAKHTPRAAQNFKCRNAFTVAVKDAGQDRIHISYGLSDSKMNATLSSARSGSGERYVSADNKTEWHQKGGEAILSFTDPYGNVTETVCRSGR